MPTVRPISVRPTGLGPVTVPASRPLFFGVVVQVLGGPSALHPQADAQPPEEADGSAEEKATPRRTAPALCGAAYDEFHNGTQRGPHPAQRLLDEFIDFHIWSPAPLTRPWPERESRRRCGRTCAEAPAPTSPRLRLDPLWPCLASHKSHTDSYPRRLDSVSLCQRALICDSPH